MRAVILAIFRVGRVARGPMSKCAKGSLHGCMDVAYRDGPLQAHRGSAARLVA